MNLFDWGARIERGVVDEVQDGMYRVRSLDRDGIISPWLPQIAALPSIQVYTRHDVGGSTVAETLSASYDPPEYTIGDMVYFFLFSDGHGAILGRMT